MNPESIGHLDLATERLVLRPWIPGDAALLRRLGALPEVVRYVGDGALWSAARADEVSDRALAHWREHGFGWRVAVEGSTTEAIGFIALNYAGHGTDGLEPHEFEIGWWLHPGAWGRGYASEGARAVRDEALGRLRAPGVVARIQPDNIASRRVAAGLGMRLDLETVGPQGEALVIYRL